MNKPSLQSEELKLNTENTYYFVKNRRYICLGKFKHINSTELVFENNVCVPIEFKYCVHEIKMLDKESILNYNNVYCNGL